MPPTVHFSLLTPNCKATANPVRLAEADGRKEVKNQKPIYNDKKKKIGYSGTVYTHNSNGESKSTGIIVRSGLDEKGRSNGQWTSKQYRENLN